MVKVKKTTKSPKAGSTEKKAKKRKKPTSSEAVEANGHTANPVQVTAGARSFPLASEITLPTRDELLALGGDEQKECFAQLGTTCERLVRLIDDTQAVATAWRENEGESRRDPHAVEDALIADMAKLRGLPTARRFSEQSLRKRMKRFTDATAEYVKAVAPGMRDEAKQKHMDMLTTQFADELNAIREKEQLNVSGVQTLLKCLDETAELAIATSKIV